MQASFERYNSQNASIDEKRVSLINSVTLVCRLEQGYLGEITNASLNYSAYLGYPEKGDIVGQTIDALLPKQIGVLHKSLLTMDNLKKVINRNREIYVTGFDGLLRHCFIDTRVNPTIKKGIESIIVLRFSKLTEDTAFVLADQNGKILAACTTFWVKIVEKNYSDPQNIEEISPSLMAGLSLLLTAEDTISVKHERGTPEILYAMRDGLGEIGRAHV